jgi:hypothetical protein
LLLVGSAKRGLRCALDIVEDAPKGAPPEAPQTEPAP